MCGHHNYNYIHDNYVLLVLYIIYSHSDNQKHCQPASDIIASEASLLHELAGAFLWYIYIYIFVSMGSPFGPAWAPSKRANVGPAG